jgi:hypothetical protein
MKSLLFHAASSSISLGAVVPHGQNHCVFFPHTSVRLNQVLILLCYGAPKKMVRSIDKMVRQIDGGGGGLFKCRVNG